MTTCIALLRGINVGQAKRIPMAELRVLFDELGYARASTLLNSGNVVFNATKPNISKVAAVIEAAIEQRFGFFAHTIVLTAEHLGHVVAENSLPQATQDPSRFLVQFVADPATLLKASALQSQSWEPEALAFGARAAYLWCANGIIESKVAQAFSRATSQATTARNWATVLRLQAAAENYAA
jgi:uncharacterized protein (DUF1697 family)